MSLPPSPHHHHHFLSLSLSPLPLHLPCSLISAPLHLSSGAFLFFSWTGLFLVHSLPPPSSSIPSSSLLLCHCHISGSFLLWRRVSPFYLPRRMGSSVFDCCEILRATSRQPSLPQRPHAIFTGDDIRFPANEKKEKKENTAGNTNSSLITAKRNGAFPAEPVEAPRPRGCVMLTRGALGRRHPLTCLLC